MQDKAIPPTCRDLRRSGMHAVVRIRDRRSNQCRPCLGHAQWSAQKAPISRRAHPTLDSSHLVPHNSDNTDHRQCAFSNPVISSATVPLFFVLFLLTGLKAFRPVSQKVMNLLLRRR